MKEKLSRQATIEFTDGSRTTVRISQGEYDRYKPLADAAGLTFGSWMFLVTLSAVEGAEAGRRMEV
jgi:hypothetical protein